MTRAILLVMVAFVAAAPASAQTRRAAVEAVVSTDGVKGSTQRRDTALWLDLFGAVRIAEGLDFVARPILSRRAFDGLWQKQMYQLGLRFERPARTDVGVGLRLDVGQMPSPIGIALLENRPDLNPVVSQHSAYYLALPRVDPEVPRVFLIGGVYPFGAQATFSQRFWDARVAVIDSSPVRGRPFFGANKPPRLLNGVVGVGVTPRAGLRFGLGIAQGAYASVDEVRDRSRGDREATMVQAEGEWAFGHTRLVGELVHSTLETSHDDPSTVKGGWIELTQTLSPRLFVATRYDMQYYGYQLPDDVYGAQHYYRVEALAGFRVSAEITVRGGYLGRRGYVVNHWDDQVIGSVVWEKKVW
jgi:hypothetical protein